MHMPRIDGADCGFPLYYGHANDPLVRIHCREPWGPCAIEGRLVRIPAEARAAAESDAHLTIVNDNTSTAPSLTILLAIPVGRGRG